MTEAEAAIRSLLAVQRDAEQLHVVAHRLANGEWALFVSDGLSREISDAELTGRIAQTLRSVSWR